MEEPFPDFRDAGLLVNHCCWLESLTLPCNLGEFTLTKRLASNKEVISYCADFTQISQPVVVRFLVGEQLHQARFRRFFQDRLRNSSKISHAAIASHIQTGELNGCCYVVREFVPGLSVAEIVERGTVPCRDAARFALEITTALIEANRQGIVHFGISSQQVILTLADGRRNADPTAPILYEDLRAIVTDLESNRLAITNLIDFPSASETTSPLQSPSTLAVKADIVAVGRLVQIMAVDPIRRASIGTLNRPPGSPLACHYEASSLRALESIAARCIASVPVGGFSELSALADELDRYLDDSRRQPLTRQIIPVIGRNWRTTAVLIALASMTAALMISLVFRSQLENNSTTLLRKQKYVAHLETAHDSHFTVNFQKSSQELDAIAIGDRHWEWGYIRRRCAIERCYLQYTKHPATEMAFSQSGLDIAILARSGLAGFSSIYTDEDLGQLGVGSSLWLTDDSDMTAFLRMRQHESFEHHNLVADSHMDKACETTPTLEYVEVHGIDQVAQLDVNLWQSTLGITARPVGDSNNLVMIGAARYGYWIQRVDGHDASIRAVAIGDAGEVFATGDSLGNIVIHDTRTWVRRLRWQGHRGAIGFLAFRPGASELFTWGEDGICVMWRPTEVIDEPCRCVSTRGIHSVAFSSSDDELVCVDDSGAVEIMDGASGLTRRSTDTPDGGSTAFAMAPQGTWFLTGDEQGNLRVWDRRRGVLAAVRQADGAVCSLSIHRIGILAAVGLSDGRVAVWDAVGGRQITSFPAHRGSVLCTAYSPDGLSLATAGEDGRVKLWAVEARLEPRVVREGGARVTSLVWSPNADWLAVGDEEGRITVWNAASGKIHASWPAHDAAVTSLAYSPDGKRLASAGRDRRVKLWDPRDGFHFPALPPQPHVITSLAFGNDGVTLAAGAESGHVKLWHAWPW